MSTAVILFLCFIFTVQSLWLFAVSIAAGWIIWKDIEKARAPEPKPEGLGVFKPTLMEDGRTMLTPVGDLDSVNDPRVVERWLNGLS